MPIRLLPVRPVPIRLVQCLAGAVAGLLIGAAAPPARAAAQHVVRPGTSIQAAVNRARPGDTIVILPGYYRESVLITTPRLTLRGSGPKTVIVPGRRVATNPCSRAGDGICVSGWPGHRVSQVRIESLTVSGFRTNGISASETDRLSVIGVTAQHNGVQGISQEKSTRGWFQWNVSRGNGQYGIFLANIADGKGGAIDTQGALISHNTLAGDRIGVVVRRARNLTVEENTITGNCGGVFVVGDNGRPRAGALTVRSNHVEGNNRYCPPNSRLPYIQGSGIVLTGVENTSVKGNEVRNNIGASPLSGGIVLFRSYVGGPSTGVYTTGNTVLGNRPADLADRDGGPPNVFAGNVCRTSEAAGPC